MASIIKRGKNYKITAYLGYDGKGNKRKSTTLCCEGSCKKHSGLPRNMHSCGKMK